MSKTRKPLGAEVWTFAFTGIFFTIVAPAYWFFSHEPAGAWALGLSAVFGWMITAFFAITGKTIDTRPEDDLDGEIAQAAGEVGFFPPSSIWPFWAALVISVIVLGPVFGWWISLLGLGFGVWALTGWVYEYYRGDYRH